MARSTKASEKQKRILEYIKECLLSRGYPPTVREICEEVGLKSTSSVQTNLDALEKAGYIERDPLLKRSIRLKGGPSREDVARIPLLGTVTAGMPILAVEQIEEYIPYGGHLSSDKPMFALHVHGDSMVNAGILDGDIIVCEQTPYAEDGDKVVALIEDEATVKTFYKEKDCFRLQPENDYMEPIYCDELAILGKVKAVIRYY